jgi:hypothetical protein
LFELRESTINAVMHLLTNTTIKNKPNLKPKQKNTADGRRLSIRSPLPKTTWLSLKLFLVVRARADHVLLPAPRFFRPLD